MRGATWLLLGAIGLGVAGCKKPRPSPEYTEASGAYSTLTAKLGDDAYSDPEMARIEALLARVPNDSVDAPAAKELLARIGQERAHAAAEAAAHQKLLDDATKAPVLPDSPSTGEPEKVVDAGPAHIGLGLTTEEVGRLGGDCFHYTQTVRVRNMNGSEAEGVIWERADLARCQEAFPDLGGRMLVFESNKLVQVVDKSQIRHEVLDAGPPAAVEAPEPPKKEPPAPPPAQPPPPPPPAGENTGPAPTE
jgi:hypothetical protein